MGTRVDDSFSKVVGLEAAVRLLRAQASADRVPHTLLLAGPEGIGKRMLALAFARHLLAGFSEDPLVVEPETKSGRIGIDQVREAARVLALTPLAGSRKVGVIPDAEALTDQAVHAALKFLEEPPPHAVLILTSAASHRLAGTLLSRCQVVRCAPQGAARVAEHLMKAEKLPAARARMLANASGGRVGTALRLAREGTLKELNAALDQILTAFERRQVELPLGDESSQAVGQALEWSLSYWRDLMALALGGRPEAAVHQDRLPELQDRAGRVRAGGPPALDRLLDRMDRTTRVLEAVRRHVPVKIALGALLSARPSD